MASFFVAPVFQPLDGNGKPYPGAKMYVYEAGTTTDLIVYSDNALTTAHTQPVVADANGIFPQIYMSADVYKFKLDTSVDVLIDTYDNVASMVAGDGGTLPVGSGGTGSTTAAGARTNLGAASQTDYTTLNTTVGNIDTELSGIGGSLGDMGAKDDVGYTDLSNIDDVCIQKVTLVDGTQTTHNSVPSIPADNTVPENTEGVEIFSQSFTPKNTNSVLEVEVYLQYYCTTTSNNIALALFQSGSSSAFAVAADWVASLTTNTMIVKGYYTPGSVSPITISARVGFNTSSTIIVNGNLYGTAMVSRMIIKEVQNSPIT